MNPKNLSKIQKSFTVQAQNFENNNMNFSKQEYLDYTVQCMNLNSDDNILEAAAGTCVCGRSIAPFVKSVTCIDATPAMLAVGQAEAEKNGIKNMKFVNGFVEDMPFENDCFDVVLSRLAFHHFSDIEKPFFEMNRVLKENGKLVIIDMEAAEESLREIEDRIETMRDFSHIKNRSQAEFLELFIKYGYTVMKEESTKIPVSLNAWMSLTDTPDDIRDEIINLMYDDINNGIPTGFHPYLKENEIYFEQRWLMFITTNAVYQK